MATKKTKALVKEEVTVQEAVVETADVVTEEVKVEKKAKKNKEKAAVATIPVLDNDTLKKLFQENGCVTRTNAANTSNVVYNTFGTQSRVMQQKKAYQLLLTNGHKNTKNGVVDTDNDDTARFVAWYNTLSPEKQKQIVGYDELTVVKLCSLELPRERSVKLTSYDLLVEFIQYMSKFPENQLVKAAE